MTDLHDVVVKTDPQSQAVRNYIEANLYEVQQKRIDVLNSLTLAEVFKGRNPFLLQATVGDAISLVKRCMESYLALTDECLIANFLKSVAEFTVECCGKNMTIIENDYQQFHRRELWESISGSPTLYLDIIECFAMLTLPLLGEMLEAYDRSLHRLLRQCYVQLCNEDASINWERLTRFISESDAQESPCDVVGRTQ